MTEEKKVVDVESTSKSTKEPVVCGGTPNGCENSDCHFIDNTKQFKDLRVKFKVYHNFGFIDLNLVKECDIERHLKESNGLIKHTRNTISGLELEIANTKSASSHEQGRAQDLSTLLDISLTTSLEDVLSKARIIEAALLRRGRVRNECFLGRLQELIARQSIHCEDTNDFLNRKLSYLNLKLTCSLSKCEELNSEVESCKEHNFIVGKVYDLMDDLHVKLLSIRDSKCGLRHDIQVKLVNYLDTRVRNLYHHVDNYVSTKEEVTEVEDSGTILLEYIKETEMVLDILVN